MKNQVLVLLIAVLMLWTLSCNVDTPTDIPLESISIDPTILTLGVGDSEQLTVIHAPPEATNKAVTWESADENIATIDQSGLVTGVSTGRLNITANSEDGNFSASCLVEVIIPITDISLDTTSAKLGPGDTLSLTATISPTNASHNTVSWSSSNEAVATVSSDGLRSATVTIQSGGRGTVEITANNSVSGYSATCNILVYDTGDFVTTWDTSDTSHAVSAENQLQLPLNSDVYPYIGSTPYDFTVYWGDGTSSEITSYNNSDILHTYNQAGTYNVVIQGTCVAFGCVLATPAETDNSKLLDVKQWGSIGLHSQGGQFSDCTNLTDFSATDTPELSNLVIMNRMFQDSSNFNADISGWDVSHVLSMDGTFLGAASFNQDLSSWDVSNVETMNSMFFSATSFNGNIATWNVSSVTDMRFMFINTPAFTGEWGLSPGCDLNAWDDAPSSVNTAILDGMFTSSGVDPLPDWYP